MENALMQQPSHISISKVVDLVSMSPGVTLLPVMSCPATCLNPFLRCLVCLSLASRSLSLLSLPRYYLAPRKCLLSRTSPSACARARCRPSAARCRCSGGGTRGAGASCPQCPPWRGGVLSTTRTVARVFQRTGDY